MQTSTIQRAPRRAFARFVTIALLVSTIAVTAAPAAEGKGPGRILVVEGTWGGTVASIPAVHPACGAGNCYDVVNAATLNLFTAANWAPYSVLYVGTFPSGPALLALQNQAANIKTWVSQGGSIIANPELVLANGAGGYRWIPDGSAMGTASYTTNSISFTALGTVHPALTGITPAQLSNWWSSTHVRFTAWPSYLQPLATGPGGHEVVLSGHYGLGCILLTGLDADVHAPYHTGAKAWVEQLFRWAYSCECVDHICEPTITITGLDTRRWPDDAVAYAGGILSAGHTHSAHGNLTGDDEELPRYRGPVTVDITTCRCLVKSVLLYSEVTVDVLPAGDGLFPTLGQTGPHKWVVTSPDTDTYEVTFELTLDCPQEDGSVPTTTYTKSWIMGP